MQRHRCSSRLYLHFRRAFLQHEIFVKGKTRNRCFKDGEKIYSILFLVFVPCGQDYRGAIIPSPFHQKNKDLNIAQSGPPSLRREELWHALALRNLPGVPICIKTPTCALGSHWRTYSNGCLAFKQQTSMESFRLLG